LDFKKDEWDLSGWIVGRVLGAIFIKCSIDFSLKIVGATYQNEQMITRPQVNHTTWVQTECRQNTLLPCINDALIDCE